ncbi:nuclear transport factor 2 family protein [Erythrobacter alti]|uniref:nuclear transport factor 2 family protein n=1 Tax=Erythrobacter alti TaxID=1896145 RepID=UPI0030F38F71
MPTNSEIVQSLYASFDTGDIAGATAVMADDIVWNEAENNHLADGNPYVGPQAVVEGVFVQLGSDFEGFRVEREAFVTEGDTVVMQGRYHFTATATGSAASPQVVHWWTVKEGRITGFQQHIDTLELARALGQLA